MRRLSGMCALRVALSMRPWYIEGVLPLLLHLVLLVVVVVCVIYLIRNINQPITIHSSNRSSALRIATFRIRTLRSRVGLHFDWYFALAVLIGARSTSATTSSCL